MPPRDQCLLARATLPLAPPPSRFAVPAGRRISPCTTGPVSRSVSPVVTSRFEGAQWSVCEYTGYKIVNSVNCGESYVLYDRGTTQPDLGSGYKYFAVPIQTAVATTTISLTFLELLGVHGTLNHLTQYTSSACHQKLVSDGLANVYVSYATNATEHAIQMSQAEVRLTPVPPTAHCAFDARCTPE